MSLCAWIEILPAVIAHFTAFLWHVINFFVFHTFQSRVTPWAGLVKLIYLVPLLSANCVCAHVSHRDSEINRLTIFIPILSL